jgi:hypothetical protein
MRYGGLIMAPINHINGVVGKAQFKVVGNYLFHRFGGEGERWYETDDIGADEIMGSWVEVK